jgi:hypothetical protein
MIEKDCQLASYTCRKSMAKKSGAAAPLLVHVQMVIAW